MRACTMPSWLRSLLLAMCLSVTSSFLEVVDTGSSGPKLLRLDYKAHRQLMRFFTLFGSVPRWWLTSPATMSRSGLLRAAIRH